MRHLRRFESEIHDFTLGLSRTHVKYTRIEIAGVLDRVADGESLDEIARGFDSYVSREAIAEAVTIANRLFTASYPAFPSLAVQKIAA